MIFTLWPSHTSVRESLFEYDLPSDFATIRSYTRGKWIKLVKMKVEIRNTERLITDCHKKEDGVLIPKTKTKNVLPRLKMESYIREPCKELSRLSKHQTKTLIIARFGMLECGANYKGKLAETCTLCNCRDDEDHRLNHCPRFSTMNLHDSIEKVDFQSVYSESIDTLLKIIPYLTRIWNTKNAHGSVNRWNRYFLRIVMM